MATTHKAPVPPANEPPSATTHATDSGSDLPQDKVIGTTGKLARPLPSHMIPTAPTIADIWHARDILRGHINVTPMLHSRTFSTMSGAEVFLKAENLQRAGSFKIRGATCKIAHLQEHERRCGVIAASAGNHAQGVAIAAQAYGIPCTIVMPEGAPLAKVTATRNYGATVIQYGVTYDDAYAHACEIQAKSGATFTHAFNDPMVIAGQGTLGLEVLDDVADVAAIIVPIGGGGLIAGIAIAAKSLRPDIKIIGVQASGANATQRSLQSGEIITLPTVNTIADGISTKRPGELNFAIMQHYVDEVVSVTDEETASAIILLMERCKLIVEGAGAVGIAALLKPQLLALANKKVVVVLSGGNIDMNLIGRFIEYGLAAQGRILILHTAVLDRPGELMRLLAITTELGVNVREVNHRRAVPLLPIQQVEVSMTLDTRNRPHAEQVMQSLREHGYYVHEAQATYGE